MNAEEKARQISQVTVRLLNKFPAGSREAVGTAVAEAVAHFVGCPIRDFVRCFSSVRRPRSSLLEA
ncbi:MULTISPECIES: three-helix bundle dimerization domain-containing protein [Rhodococcus]|uniref:Uncharacterized protein n=1 Tax=Rhodococcus wratislaviensis TaxID=44752 RepID=A0A402CM30_RHOWR|nr:MULTISPECIES: hypothetical protein [Rhodococcus]GCE44687.1 hypothetical protein Rhow_000278 [Rhodococcus wratislaviensis]